MHDKAAKLYAEVAGTALSSFLISKDFSMVVPLRIHRGAEEDKDVLRRFRGEDGEDFKILEYQAQIGHPSAMYRTGLFYYFSLRGIRHDHAKAMYWFSEAAEKRELRSMEILGEIYALGTGVEKNYTKAFRCLTLAAEGGLYSAYTGLGYLYLKGYGVDKNYTKVSLFLVASYSPAYSVFFFFFLTTALFHNRSLVSIMNLYPKKRSWDS